MLTFISARAKGDIPTGANFIRQVINQLDVYNHDSQLSPCVISLLINQILNLHKESIVCKCEKLTDSQSDEEEKYTIPPNI